METSHHQDKSSEQHMDHMIDLASAELESIVRSSAAATGRLVDLLEEASQLRLERDKLQMELDRVQSRTLSRIAVQLERLGWGLRRLLAPVQAVDRRALAVLARHNLERETALVRLVFDPTWYRSQLEAIGEDNLPDGRTGLLRHYIMSGEARGLQPTRLLDPHFYARQTVGVVPGTARALLHFLEHGMDLATPPRADLENLGMKALADGQTPAVWMFTYAADLARQ